MANAINSTSAAPIPPTTSSDSDKVTSTDSNDSTISRETEARSRQISDGVTHIEKLAQATCQTDSRAVEMTKAVSQKALETRGRVQQLQQTQQELSQSAGASLQAAAQVQVGLTVSEEQQKALSDRARNLSDRQAALNCNPLAGFVNQIKGAELCSPTCKKVTFVFVCVIGAAMVGHHVFDNTGKGAVFGAAVGLALGLVVLGTKQKCDARSAVSPPLSQPFLDQFPRRNQVELSARRQRSNSA